MLYQKSHFSTWALEEISALCSLFIYHSPSAGSWAEQKGWALIKNKEHLQDPGFTSSPHGTVRPMWVDRNEHVPNSCALKQPPQCVSHSKDGVSPLTTFCLYHWQELRETRHAQEGPADHSLRATLTSCPQHLVFLQQTERMG